METHEWDLWVGLGKTRNGTSEQVSGSCTLSSLHKLMSSPVLCDTLTFIPVPLPLSSSGPSKSWPWKSKLRYLLFGTSSTALALGTADNLNFLTRVIEVGLEKQRWVIQPISVPGSTGPRSPAVALSRAAHPRVAGDCRPCICTGFVPRDAAETFREGSTKLRLGW